MARPAPIPASTSRSSCSSARPARNRGTCRIAAARRAVVDVIGGQIPLASVDLTSAYPHIQAGRLRALGLIDGKRFAVAPEIATIAESVPGFGRASGFIGLFAPAGTPAPI